MNHEYVNFTWNISLREKTLVCFTNLFVGVCCLLDISLKNCCLESFLYLENYFVGQSVLTFDAHLVWLTSLFVGVCWMLMLTRVCWLLMYGNWLTRDTVCHSRGWLTLRGLLWYDQSSQYRVAFDPSLHQLASHPWSSGNNWKQDFVHQTAPYN